jgi:Fe-S-cluster containining protein
MSEPKVFYQCQRCGNCCRWPGEVILTEKDISRISAHLGLSEFDFIQQHTAVRRNRAGLTLTEKPNGECEFLDGIECTIQPVKPEQCAGFPNTWNFPGWQKSAKRFRFRFRIESCPAARFGLMSFMSKSRRDFLKTSAAGAGAAAALPAAAQWKPYVVGFDGPDSLVHGKGWETLNPGYWQIKDHALRRRLSNYGDRARRTGFPFHSATAGKVMETDYDPSLPEGIIYQKQWNLRGDHFEFGAIFEFHGDRPEPAEGDNPDWKMYQDGYGYFGVAFGAKSVWESYGKNRNAIQIVWSDDGKFRFLPEKKAQGKNAVADAPKFKPGDTVELQVNVTNKGAQSEVVAKLGGVEIRQHFRREATEGFFGITGRGLIDFGTKTVWTGGDPKPAEVGELDCYACYPLGDSLKLDGDAWRVRFVSLFAADGEKAEVRIADSENPDGGWEKVAAAGSGAIVNHEWRRNTAVIEAKLPRNPADTDLFYTIWKDGVNVTSDPRIGTAACGPGTGLVGDVPESGAYVGRLPRLQAPYKLCGLSCHAITSGLQQRDGKGWKMVGGSAEWQLRDQPTVEAYKHLDDYDFQVMVWEDDVWYMELVLYPPSTDDAYQVVKNSICGPTSRWQMMRHWNVINPGDHDYGMDDVKGPEQLAIRRVEGLGQDVDYMRRNFQIVHHLTTGDEEADPLGNPKKWRAWKMPNRDFTFVILDSRLWRSSQDTDMWDDAGWDAFKSLYDRTDPTRSLLGEEQFGWLQQLLATDSSTQICLTGVNGMHTIWTGMKNKVGNTPFDQRDRVTADYAGWVKAGADRVLELLGSRDGVVTVYGDVHNGCIMKNLEHGVIECSFGPIGRSGGREDEGLGWA